MPQQSLLGISKAEGGPKILGEHTVSHMPWPLSVFATDNGHPHVSIDTGFSCN